MMKRMEQRNRGMESIRDTEDDAGPVFKRSRLAGAATYVPSTVFRDVGNIVTMFWRLIACLTPGPSRSHSWSKQILLLVLMKPWHLCVS